MISMCCWQWAIDRFVVDTGQLALTDGPTDECHVGNVTKHQFYMVTLLVGQQGVGRGFTVVRVFCAHVNRIAKIQTGNTELFFLCLHVCVCMFSSVPKHVNLLHCLVWSCSQTSLVRNILIFSLIECTETQYKHIHSSQ